MKKKTIAMLLIMSMTFTGCGQEKLFQSVKQYEENKGIKTIMKKIMGETSESVEYEDFLDESLVEEIEKTKEFMETEANGAQEFEKLIENVKQEEIPNELLSVETFQGVGEFDYAGLLITNNSEYTVDVYVDLTITGEEIGTEQCSEVIFALAPGKTTFCERSIFNDEEVKIDYQIKNRVTTMYSVLNDLTTGYHLFRDELFVNVRNNGIKRAEDTSVMVAYYDKNQNLIDADISNTLGLYNQINQNTETVYHIDGVPEYDSVKVFVRSNCDGKDYTSDTQDSLEVNNYLYRYQNDNSLDLCSIVKNTTSKDLEFQMELIMKDSEGQIVEVQRVEEYALAAGQTFAYLDDLVPMEVVTVEPIVTVSQKSSVFQPFTEFDVEFVSNDGREYIQYTNKSEYELGSVDCVVCYWSEEGELVDSDYSIEFSVEPNETVEYELYEHVPYATRTYYINSKIY